MAPVDLVRRFDPFGRLSPQGQAVLSRGVVRSAARRGDTVLHKGQAVSGAYLVVEGRLRVFTIAPNGTEATLYFIDPGQTCVLALNCLFNDLLYPAWVQAETAAVVAVIPGPVYRQLFQVEPLIQELTVRTLSTLVFQLMSQLEQVHASHHKQRLAQFILLHAAADGSLRMTQQQLAQHLGTTREVIARLMQHFVGRGMLKTQRGVVHIRDPVELRRVVAPDPTHAAQRPRARTAPD